MDAAIRLAISSFFGLFRAKELQVDPVIKRLQTPVHKVARLPRFVDGFEGARGNTDSKRQATAGLPFLKDGFQAAVRKPVELAPKMAPAVQAAPAWLKENDKSLPRPDFVASFLDL